MRSEFTPPEPIQTAVLFLIFNRPETTAQVFEAIRKAEPPRLYVAADGPREGREGEAEKAARVREIATAVDWQCEVKTLFRRKNLGCKRAVSSGVDWLFEHEERGIILEDDCSPSQSFFWFCEQMLNRYADEERIMAITGNNFQDGVQRGGASYYFSRYAHVWGWATWRRAWQKYDRDLSFWPNWKRSKDWPKKLTDRVERRYWRNILDQIYAHKIDTWDYQWIACVWYHNGLTVTPNANLVSNIGFGADATHTFSENSSLARIPAQALGAITHPKVIAQDEDADRYVCDYLLNLRYQRFPFVFVYRIYKTLCFLKKNVLRMGQ